METHEKLQALLPLLRNLKYESGRFHELLFFAIDYIEDDDLADDEKAALLDEIADKAKSLAKKQVKLIESARARP